MDFKIKWFKWAPDEKHIHIIGCIMLMIGFVFFLDCTVTLSLLFVFIIGAVIELMQMWFKKGGFFDWTDIIYNMGAAGFTGAMIELGRQITKLF